MSFFRSERTQGKAQAPNLGSTNVYEEKSLGIYSGGAESEYEPNPEPKESRTAVWGKYLGWHIRRQLAFGKSHVGEDSNSPVLIR